MNSEAKSYKRLQNPMQIAIEVEQTKNNESTEEAILEQIKQIPHVKVAILLGSGIPDASFSGETQYIRNSDFRKIIELPNANNVTSITLESIDGIVRTFIETNKSLLASAYKMRDRGTEQHYALALKEDNEENRDIFLDFMLDYNDTREGKMFPISFHFVRAELIRKAGGLEPIIRPCWC